MLDRLYTRLLALSQHPKALWVLALVAFAESSVFPIPPDFLILPMVLAAPSRAWIIASVAMVASVAGGMIGYAIGAVMFEQLGQPILQALGKGDAIEEFNQRFNSLGFWAVLGAGLTPFPYKVIYHYVWMDWHASGYIHRHVNLGAWLAIFYCRGTFVEIRGANSRIY